MSKIKAVIFDMDGVLIDAREWHYEALNKALALFGYEISRYDHLVTYDGLPTKKKLEMLSKERNLPVQLHNFINELKQKYTADMIQSFCKPTFQHQYALSNLKAKGYRLACCSNSIRSTIESMLTRADLMRYLEFFVSNQDVKHSKPDPEIYLKAIQRLELKPSECLVVEDNQNGIKAAMAAGCPVLEVKNTDEVHIDRILKKIEELNHG